MQEAKTTRNKNTRINVGVSSRLCRRTLVVAALLCALTAGSPIFAQTTRSTTTTGKTTTDGKTTDGASPSTNAVTESQLTIGSNTELSSISDGVGSIVFTGPHSLILDDGQTLRAILVSKEDGANLILGNGDKQGQSWTFTANNPSWSGTIDVLTGNELTIAGGNANPLGSYSESLTNSFATLNLYDGSTFKLPAKEVGANGQPVAGETRIGALMTDSLNDADSELDAVVNVGNEQTLTVEDGLYVSPTAGLTKLGGGTLQFLVNGNVSKQATSDGVATDMDVTTFNFGDTLINAGKVVLKSGTMDISETDIDASSLWVADGAELDIQYAGKIEIAGRAGDVVFSADDGSKIDLYVDGEGSTSFVATTYNTYIDVGETTLNVNSTVKGSKAPTSMTVFSTENVGQTFYDADKIKVTDNLLGKNYVVDVENSTDQTLLLKLEKNKSLSDSGKTGNQRALGEYLDRTIDSEKYTDAEYKFLDRLEKDIDKVDFSKISGELHASTVGFMYMNNFTTTQSLFDMLRNNSLVAYSAQNSSVSPMNYGEGQYGARGGAANGAFDNGRLIYNEDANSYGPGVVPIYNNQGQPVYSDPTYTGAVYNGENYGNGVGGMSGASYYSGESEFNNMNGYGGATYNGGYDPGFNGGYESNYGNGFSSYNYGRANRLSVWDYSFGLDSAAERSTLVTTRAQEGGVQYGDPGTLIYSAWLMAVGGAQDAEVHKDAYGYTGKQGGFLAGLDLFCSCDCRFGAYYGYQRNEMKNLAELGKTKSDDHTVGLYHQFGDETIYNILSIRGGYDRVQTTRQVDFLGDSDTLSAKYNAFNGGASIERGANFAARPFVFSPYASLDYNYFYRQKFDETSLTNSLYRLHAGKSDYHSLRGQIGGRIALDMYPGSQQLRLVARAAYAHEFLNPTYGKTTLSLIDLPSADGGFNVYGNSLGRDWAIVGLGLDWTPIPALVLFGKSDYLFNKYVGDTFNSVGLKYRW